MTEINNMIANIIPSKKIIYDYLKKNVACDNWGVVCLDDFCKEYGFNLDLVCDTLDEMKDKVLCAYFMENFGGCGCQMLDYDLI